MSGKYQKIGFKSMKKWCQKIKTKIWGESREKLRHKIKKKNGGRIANNN